MGNYVVIFSERDGGYNLNIKVHMVRTTRKSFCVSACGVKLWNGLGSKHKQRQISQNLNQCTCCTGKRAALSYNRCFQYRYVQCDKLSLLENILLRKNLPNYMTDLWICEYVYILLLPTPFRAPVVPEDNIFLPTCSIVYICKHMLKINDQ